MAAARQFLRLTNDPLLIRATIGCVAETFASSTDPFTACFGLTKPEWAAMCTGFIERSARAAQPLSVVCVNKTTGAVDGVMINEDYCTPTPNSYRHLGPGWRATRAIFKSLHETFNSSHLPVPQPGDFLHTVYFTCVREEARGQKVMQSLWRNTIDIARDNNFPAILAEASTEDVRQVLSERLGFREVASKNFRDFKVDEDSGAATPGEVETVFEKLVALDPRQFSRLSLLKRSVPSNLYV